MRYAFEIREPLVDSVVLAVRVDVKENKEHLWLGPETEVGHALHKPGASLYFAEVRPLGAFWCEFAKSWGTAWADAILLLSQSLEAWNRKKRDKAAEGAAGIFRKLTEENPDNAAVWYGAVQIWEMYLKCRRGRNRNYAAEFLRRYAERIILPFGEYTPEMFHWQREQPVMPVWNCREDAKLQVWYPHGKVPFECGVTSESLRPMLIYYRQRILDAGLLMRKCRQCGKIFFASDSRTNLCSDECRNASKKAARKSFEDKAKGQPYEQAYDREYMFWYNRIVKLKKGDAPPEQLKRAEDAFKSFCAKASRRKNRVKDGAMTLEQFTDWMIQQERLIQEICGE